MENELPLGKRLLFWALLAAMPVVFAALLGTGYFYYKYATYPARYCKPFGQLDAEIGWVIEPGVESCLNGTDPATGEIAYRSTIRVNAEGARAARVDAPTPATGRASRGTPVLRPSS